MPAADKRRLLEEFLTEFPDVCTDPAWRLESLETAFIVWLEEESHSPPSKYPRGMAYDFVSRGFVRTPQRKAESLRIEGGAKLFARFNDEAREVIGLAIEEALTLKRQDVDSEVILLGLLAEKDGIAAKALVSLGISLQEARLRIRESRHRGGGEPPNPLPLGSNAKYMLEEVHAVAKEFGSYRIGPEHLLLGLMRDSISSRALTGLGVNLNGARVRVLELLYQYSPDASLSDVKIPASSGSLVLDEFGRDLIQAAHDHTLDRPLGQHSEMHAIVQILLGEAGTNSLLIGHRDAGVTSVIHGIADYIAGRPASELSYRRMHEIDLHDLIGPPPDYYDERSFNVALAELLAGIPGQEKSIIAVENAFRPTDVLGGDVYPIAFMRPVLERGEHSVLATATPVDYARYLADGGELADFFHVVEMGELDAQEAIEVLKAYRRPCEMRHQVAITDEAIEAAVMLSSNLMPGRSLPGKALDLLDETAARATRLIVGRYPSSFDELADEITAVVSAKHIAIDNADFDEAATLRAAEARLGAALARQREVRAAGVADLRATISERDVAETVAALGLRPR